MPLSSLGSYIPTLNEFLAHWELVNKALGASPLTLPGGYAVAHLTTDRDVLQTLITNIETANNAVQQAAAERDQQLAPLRERLRQFRAFVRGRLAGTVHVPSLPKMPPTHANESIVLRALDDMANGWSRINARPPSGFTAPLTLTGGYTLALFQTEVAALRTAYGMVTSANEAARFARDQRDEMVSRLRQRLVQYRQTVLGTFAAGHALLTSLPALSPPAGSTPEAVRLSGTWDAQQGQAVMTWTASPAADLKHDAVRYHAGPRYRAAEEQAVMMVAKTETRLATDFGLAASGSSAWFKVYVVTQTENERGSNAVRVVRT
jgi:hypothetical protein